MGKRLIRNIAESFWKTARVASRQSPPQGYVPDTKADHNWDADFQPLEGLPDFAAHIAVNKALVPAYLNLMADIVIAAGYAPESAKSDIVRGMTSATGYERDKNGHLTANRHEYRLPGLSFRWRLKSEESCHGKALDSMKAGRYKDRLSIGDYFAAKLIGDTVTDIVRLRQAVLMTEHRMTSRKCEYSFPSTEGFRCHKSHHEVEDNVPLEHLPYEQQEIVAVLCSPDGKNALLRAKGELMISDRPSENIEAFTHALKNAERGLEKASHAFASAFLEASCNMPVRMTGWSSQLREVRKFFNDSMAFVNGLDALTAPGQERGMPEVPRGLVTRTKRILLNSQVAIPEELMIPARMLLGAAVTRRVQVADSDRIFH